MANTTSKAAIAAPKEWPGAFKLYSISKEAMLVNWQTYLGVLLVSFAFSFVVSAVFGSDTSSGMYALGQFVSMLLSVFIAAATTVIMFRNVARKQISFNESLSEGLKYYVSFIVMFILMYVIAALSLLAFIIPFFFVAPRIALSPYFLVAKNMGPVDAVKASWDETKGHAGKVWGIIGVNVLIALLIFTIIGIPFAMYFFFMYSAAMVLLYSWIQANNKTTA